MARGSHVCACGMTTVGTAAARKAKKNGMCKTCHDSPPWQQPWNRSDGQRQPDAKASAGKGKSSAPWRQGKTGSAAVANTNTSQSSDGQSDEPTSSEESMDVDVEENDRIATLKEEQAYLEAQIKCARTQKSAFATARLDDLQTQLKAVIAQIQNARPVAARLKHLRHQERTRKAATEKAVAWRNQCMEVASKALANYDRAVTEVEACTGAEEELKDQIAHAVAEHAEAQAHRIHDQATTVVGKLTAIADQCGNSELSERLQSLVVFASSLPGGLRGFGDVTAAAAAAVSTASSSSKLTAGSERPLQTDLQARFDQGAAALRTAEAATNPATPPVEEPEAALPPGWSVGVCAVTHKPYYWDGRMETQWEKPKRTTAPAERKEANLGAVGALEAKIADREGSFKKTCNSDDSTQARVQQAEEIRKSERSARMDARRAAATAEAVPVPADAAMENLAGPGSPITPGGTTECFVVSDHEGDKDDSFDDARRKFAAAAEATTAAVAAASVFREGAAQQELPVSHP